MRRRSLLLPGVHNFVAASGFSCPGVQIFSRAAASSAGIRFTSATIAVERVAQAHVLAQLLVRGRRASTCVDEPVDVLGALGVGLLAHELARAPRR